jgi:hypothetical protein
MSQQCKCSMSISMLGDGCRYCQPQTHIDTYSLIIEELESEVEALEKERDDLKGKTSSS